MKKAKVIFIVADECDECSDVKKKVTSILEAEGIEYEMEALPYSTDRAINLAIVHGLDTLPSFIVNQTGFNGKLILKEAIVSAAKG